jgi:murein DD-endopeptidase MepM/ murein hydrolase activator NlpD
VPTSARHRGPRHGTPRRGALVAAFAAVVALLLTATGVGAQTDPTDPSTIPPSTLDSTTTTSSTVPVGPDTPIGPDTPLTTLPGQTTTTIEGVPAPPTLTPSEVAELRLLSSDYELATADEIQFLERYLMAQQQATLIADEVQKLNLKFSTVQAELTAAQGRVDVADKELKVVDARLLETHDELERERERLRTQAVLAYMGGGSASGTATAEAVVRAETMNDLSTSLVYADTLVSEQRRTIARVAELRDEVERLLDEAEAKQEIATKARDEVAGRKSGVEAERAAQELLRAKVQANADLQQQLLKEVSEKRAGYAERITALTRVSDGISETLAKRQVGQDLPLVTAGIMLPPLEKLTFSSPFGPRVDPILGDARMHNGVDLSAPSGTPIRATADGVVVIAGDQGGYGICTVIDHGSGLGTLYGHQSALGVQTGDVVKRGQIIGFVGSTGKSTGPHLHWEVRQFGQPVNPVPFLGPG